ncbi:unnamed protein product [Polarella glacialis]|uniref:FHA domain-containing protein n=1 Tax=Polarella glacialis TaxID=89957 RepID=A0A813KPJ7_POLGL|nr:unnamed protein product [Polarella glacialis]
MAAPPLGLMSSGDQDLFSDSDGEGEGVPLGLAEGARYDQPKSEWKKEEIHEENNRGVVTTEIAVETEPVEDKPFVAGKDACPELICGPRYTKAVKLTAGQWIKIGRDQTSHVLLENIGISRNHCSIRWDDKSRTVEFKDTSHSGTLVNREIVQSERRTLLHGQHICIEGKGVRYEFYLDLRPVRLGVSDPRSGVNSGGVSVSQIQKREQLRSLLTKLKVSCAKKERTIFDQENTFYEMVAENAKVAAKDKDDEEKAEHLKQDTVALEQQLDLSRQEWMAKLKEEYTANETGEQDVLEAAKDLQDKLSKLELKKVELERAIYPERFAVADLPDFDTLGLKAAASPADGGIQAEAGDVDGEQEAFAPTPLPSPAVLLSEAAASALAFRAAPAPAPADLELDDLFGEIEGEVARSTQAAQAEDDDDDAPLAGPAEKRQRVEGGSVEGN